MSIGTDARSASLATTAPGGDRGLGVAPVCVSAISVVDALLSESELTPSRAAKWQRVQSPEKWDREVKPSTY